MKRSRASDRRRRAGLIAGGLAVGLTSVAAGAWLVDRSSWRRLGALARGRASGGAEDSGRTSPDDSYTCQCGAEYRVSGIDRHRIYWPADAPEGSPVLGDRCVQCGTALPTGHATSSQETR
jgi:hypothetical protein